MGAAYQNLGTAFSVTVAGLVRGSIQPISPSPEPP
jgi:hypothetical protein